MRKFAKLTGLLCIALATCITFAACKADGAKGKVIEDIKDYKSTTELGDAFNTYNLDASSSTEKYAKGFFKKVKDFDYDIEDVEESKDGETAVVTVCITTYDFGTAYIEVWNEMIEGDNSVSTDTSKLYNTLFKKLNAVEKKEYTKSVKINCSKDADGNWETDIGENSDFTNAVYGGMIDVVTELSKITS